MNMTGWTYLFQFCKNLHIYGKGMERAGVDEDGNVVVMYRMDARSRNNPRCKECLATHVCNDAT